MTVDRTKIRWSDGMKVLTIIFVINSDFLRNSIRRLPLCHFKETRAIPNFPHKRILKNQLTLLRLAMFPRPAWTLRSVALRFVRADLLSRFAGRDLSRPSEWWFFRLDLVSLRVSCLQLRSKVIFWFKINLLAAGRFLAKPVIVGCVVPIAFVCASMVGDQFLTRKTTNWRIDEDRESKNR
jgi:hypothetical protein